MMPRSCTTKRPLEERVNVLVVMVLGGLIDWKFLPHTFWSVDGLSARTPHVPGAIDALAMLRSRVFLPDQIFFLVRGDDSPESRRRTALWMAHNRVRQRTGITPLGSSLLFTDGHRGSSALALHRVKATCVIGWRFEPEELGVPSLDRAYTLDSNHRPQNGSDPTLRVVDSWQQVQEELLPPVRTFTPAYPPPRAMSSQEAHA